MMILKIYRIYSNGSILKEYASIIESILEVQCLKLLKLEYI